MACGLEGTDQSEVYEFGICGSSGDGVRIGGSYDIDMGSSICGVLGDGIVVGKVLVLVQCSVMSKGGLGNIEAWLDGVKVEENGKMIS